MFNSNNFIQPSDFIGENIVTSKNKGSTKPGPEVNLMFMNGEQFARWLAQFNEPKKAD